MSTEHAAKPTSTGGDAKQAPPQDDHLSVTHTHGPGLGDSFRAYVDKVRGGDIGALPAVLGIIVLVAFFTAMQGATFFSASNFANLLNQGAATIVIAMGLVFVLLLGEIDLSAGFAAGTAGAVLAVALSTYSLSWYVALLLCLGTGVIIGLIIGLMTAKIGIPSFVVTLAAFLALQGIMLLIIGQGGTIGVTNSTILAIMNKNLSPMVGWILFAVTILVYAAVTGRRMISRRKKGLPAMAQSLWLFKVISLAVLLGVTTYVLNMERSQNPDLVSIKGIPMVVPIIGIILVALTFLLQRTAFGRHVYAVGGNAEAARRAGIRVPWVKIICFMSCSTMAAFAGVLLVSRDNSVSPSTGGATTLLYAVGAAVIGGVSLFGGRGLMRDAVLGGLVVAIIANGLPLITQASGIQFIVTGAVLALAASVDALSRKRASSTGRI